MNMPPNSMQWPAPGVVTSPVRMSKGTPKGGAGWPQQVRASARAMARAGLATRRLAMPESRARTVAGLAGLSSISPRTSHVTGPRPLAKEVVTRVRAALDGMRGRLVDGWQQSRGGRKQVAYGRSPDRQYVD